MNITYALAIAVYAMIKGKPQHKAVVETIKKYIQNEMEREVGE